MDTLEFFDGFSHSRRKPAYSESETLQIEGHPGASRALLVHKRNVLMQHVPLPAAQLYDEAVSKFQDYLRVKTIRGAEELVSQSLYETCIADLCEVRRSVTSWPPLAVQCLCSNVFIAYQFKPDLWIRVASLVAEWFSLHERLIFQCVSKNISPQLKEELKRKVWESLEADGEALLNRKWEQYRYELQENAVALS